MNSALEIAQGARWQPRPAGLKGRPRTLVLLARAHPDAFEDALRTVIGMA